MTAKATSDPGTGDGILRIGDAAEEPKHDVLFRLRGKEYHGLTNPGASVLFRYLDLQRKRGADVALSWLLEEVLSEDAYATLMTDSGLSRPDFDEVCDLVRAMVYGRKTAPKSPSRGRGRTGG